MNRMNITEGPQGQYILEVALILMGAFVLGYLLRLMLNAKQKTQIASLKMENAVLQSRIEESAGASEDLALYASTVKNQKDEIDRLNTKLSDCYSIKLKVENELVRAVDETKKLRNESQVIVTKPSSKPTMEIVKEGDDLKRIEGVGPKIEQLLNADNINNFKDLMEAEVSRIKATLFAAGPNYAVHDPSTWAEQAKLASEAKWGELKSLQEALKGGKRK